jgi:hypothetical protein
MEAFFGPWDLGKLVSDTFNIYLKNWMYYIAIVFGFVVVTALIGWGMVSAAGGTAWLPGVYYPQAWTWTGFFKALGFGLLFALISMIINTLMNCTFIHAMGQQYFEQKISMGKAFSAALKKVVAVIMAILLRGIIIVALCITLVGIPIAIYFALKWIFVTHVILFEGKSVSESLSRSSDLVKNNWWRILVYIIIMAIIVGIINWVLGYIPVVGSAIGTIITTPITIIATTLIYFSMRVEKEKYSTAQLKIDMDTWDTTYAKPVYPAPSAPKAPAAPQTPAAPDMMYCPSCGKQTSTKASFCSNCGKPLDIGKPKDDAGSSDGPFIK